MNPSGALAVQTLSLRDFRSYTRLECAFAPGLNVLHGPNGAGKTNLLEALALLALGRSPRTSRDADLVRRGQSTFAIRVRFGVDPAAGQATTTLEVTYGEHRGKRARLDGQVLPRMVDVYGHLLAVYFAPDDLWLLKGGPAGRRQLLDRLLAQCSPLYADSIFRYRHALAQRNQTLRDVRTRRAGASLLAIWEPQLVQYGAEVLRYRASAVAELEPLAAAAYHRLAAGAEELQIRYRPALGAGDGWTGDETAWADHLREAFREHLQADLATGMTGRGPHRDDLEVLLEGAPARVYGSQGQQRTAILALKFAEREYLALRTGRRPLLLVDDVFSELDEPRRRGLQERLQGGGQVFLTTADPRQLQGMVGASFFRVLQGSVVPEEPHA